MRRAVIYLFYDPQGQVDDYVLHTLTHLRPYAELIFVVSNSPLDARATDRLESVADRVWVRKNIGFDVWAFKESLEQIGAEELATYDEVLMLNSTCFGPVGSFEQVFADMDARDDIDFWGITDHRRMRRHPIKKDRPLAHHIQTHWLAARKRLVTSPEWAEYWSTMPMIETYHDSIDHHETRFTPYFVERGYTCATSFPAENYGSVHPIMDNPVAMVRDGCPLVKRRSFFYDPLYNEWKGTDPRQLAGMMERRGYPMDQVYRNLARTSQPRLLATNMGWMDVLPEVDLGYDRDHPLRIVGIAHIFYPEMTDEIVDHLDRLPHDYDLVVTTTDEKKRAVISAALARRGRSADIRIVKSNRGRDISAFFIDCKDVLESGRYDIVVKVHSKKQPQDNPNVQELFKRHMFEN
ncbi:MAG TPA: rhamnan synthesis F family protein, partial [Nocardioides sp.]|nr:rhamnan synthesis F family protein [Nocardioides sp.]